MADNKGEIKCFGPDNREKPEMSNLTDEGIRQLGCNEWARLMEAYGSGRPNSLCNQHQIQMERRRCSVISRRQKKLQFARNQQIKSANTA